MYKLVELCGLRNTETRFFFNLIIPVLSSSVSAELKNMGLHPRPEHKYPQSSIDISAIAKVMQKYIKQARLIVVPAFTCQI